MSTVISQQDKDKLYTQALHLLGMPVRSVELTEEQMDTFLELSISEYEQLTNDWLIESQWSSLVGLNVDTQSLSRAFTTRDLNFETQFTYAYSKIVGLQTDGPWELKKDFIELERGQQLYTIPAGREINELLWFTRAELTDSIVDPFLGGFGGLGGVAFGGVGGFAQVGSSGSYFMLPAFDLLLRMQDRNIKNRLIGGDLTWSTINKPAQNWVRKYFIAYCKEALGRIYGKFSGDIKVPDSEVKLDYTSLQTEAKDEKLKLVEELNLRLERLRPDKMLERKGLEAENLNKSLKFRALPSPINVI